MTDIERKVYGPERLRVYHLALDLAIEIDGVVELGRCSASLAEQLLRAADSVVLNIAEGAAHYSAGKKIYHYRLAHGSAAECIAGITRLYRQRPRPILAQARRRANMICIMLSALIQKQEQRRLGSSSENPR